MGEKRVHPATTDTDHQPPPAPSPSFYGETPGLPNPPPSKSTSPQATYVVQFPREQILWYPPPENAKKFETLARRRNSRSCCRCLCCFAFCFLLLLAVAAGISALCLYLVLRVRSPRYMVTTLATRGVNATSAAIISPGFDVTIEAENRNARVGIYYLRGSSVNVLFDGLRLSGGAIPVFYQPRRNVTVLQTALTGPDVVLGGEFRTALGDAHDRRRIPFVVRIKAPVKLKVGSVKSWEINFKVKCDVVLYSLDERARIVYRDCDFSMILW